jgi:DNA topoisomerase-1
MLHFGKALSEIRKRLKSDISQAGLPLTKVLALVVTLMENTHIRIGNHVYEKEYGSFGLTTLKDRHVKIEGGKAKFNFVGKKGVHHDIDLTNKKLVKLIKQCQDIPGKELFQYYDEDGKHYAIDSGMVNDYIHEISEDSFTAKDFRTWSGTVLAYRALKGAGCCESQAEAKRQIVAALDEVSNLLGNTRTVCKKYYVHPAILSLYEDKKLEKFLEKDTKSNGADFLPDEKEVMKILESV